jgi:glucose-6-phosphate 1-epimerase
MTISQLTEQFAIPGVLAFFATPSGLVYAEVTSEQAKATVYLQGAHLAEWQPAGERPVLFLSRKSEFVPGKAIRGGVPIVFPWFGPRHDGKTGPSHGFARSQDWTLAFAAVADDELHLTFTLAPTELSRCQGYDHFNLVYQLTIGRSLTMQLSVANNDKTPLVFEEALHTYFAIGDIHDAAITGLEGVTYLDKADGAKVKVQNGAIVIEGFTDRVYLDTASTCVLHDRADKRRIVVAKTNSTTTVVWNPWQDATAKLADMEPDGWRGFCAIESANAATDAVTLAPGLVHTMATQISVEKAKP